MAEASRTEQLNIIRKNLKTVEAKFVVLEQDPKKNEKKLRILREQAERLVASMIGLEAKELAEMRMLNPDEAIRTAEDLEPIVDEAEDIRKQLAELNEQEININKEESDIDKQIETLNKTPEETSLNKKYQERLMGSLIALTGGRFIEKFGPDTTIDENGCIVKADGTKTNFRPSDLDYPAEIKKYGGMSTDELRRSIQEEIESERNPSIQSQEPAPNPVVTIDTVADQPDSGEAPIVAEEQPIAQPVPTPDKPKKGRKPKKQNPDPAVAPADTEETPNIDQESQILQEVNSFIAEFGLEEFLPKDFRKLKQEQQLKTIRDLKQRLVDIVKQDSKNQYSAIVKNEKNRSNIFGKILIGARELIQKERNIKNTEREQFENIKNTEEGREIMAEQMKLLADINRSQDIVVGESGELLVDYSKALQIEGAGTEGRQARDRYNIAANAFRSIPYEWSQGKEGSKERMAYEDARTQYEEAVGKVLGMKEIMGYEKAQAVKDMLEVKNSLMLEQLLNTHPEIEIEFGKLGQEAGNEQVWETIRRLTGTQNRQNAGLFVAGFGVRTLTKATLGVMAMPIVGGVFGYFRAKAKTEQNLVEKEKEARYGANNTGPGSRNVASVEFKDSKGREAGLHHKLDSLIAEIKRRNGLGEDCTALLAKLSSRIKYTEGKIEAGLVNFGGQKDALKNQYLLLDALNQALVLVNALEFDTTNELSARLDNILAIRSSKITKEQKQYIEDKAWEGAVRGAGIATAGYIVRAIGEEAGWWGGETPEARPYSEETADSKPFVDSRYVAESSPELAKAEEYVAQAEKHYRNAQEYYDNATGEDKQAALEALNGAKAELDFQRKYLEGVATGTIVATEAPVDSVKSPIKTDTITRQSTYTPPEKDTTITTTPETTVKSDSLEVASAKAREAQKVYEEALEKQRNAKTYGENASAETELARAKEESLSANKKLEETAKAYREEKNAPQSEQSEPAKKVPKTERPSTKAPKAERGEDRVTDTENRSGETRKDTVVEEEEKPRVNRRPGRLAKQDTTTTEAHPSAAPETKATVGDMDPNAIVGEGEGVTFAFKHQLEADPALGEALKKQIGYEGKIGTKAFYEALGREFGYIKPNGEWIGVSEGDVAAYKFVKVGDSYKVYEYHLKGTKWEIVERHKAGDGFEGEDYEKEYEYLNTPKRKPEVADGDGDEATEPGPSENNNGQFARKPKVGEGDLNNGQLARTPKPGSQNLDNGQLARAPKGTGNGTPKPEDDAQIKTKTVSRTEKVIPPVEKGRPVILESDKQDVKWTIEPGPPDGRPWIVEDFKLVGGKALRLFADRYGYDELTNSQVDFVGQRYRFNLNKIFEKSSDWTDKWSKESATRLLRMNIKGEVDTNKEELSTYVKMLHDAVKASGKTMEPFNDGFVGNKETTKDYILRMLFELEKRGKLETFNDKFDAFMKGQGESAEGASASDSNLDNAPGAPANVDQAVKADYENAMISVFSNEHDPRGIGMERWNELKDSESMDAEYFIETTVKDSNAYRGFEAYPGFTKMIDFMQGLHDITKLKPANNEGSDSYINRCLEHIEKSTSAKDNKALEKLLRESSR